MSKIRLHGSSSGYTEIAPVAASGNNTLTLPNDGTIISQDSNGAVGVTSITVGTGVTIGDGRLTASSGIVGLTSTGMPSGSIIQVISNNVTATSSVAFGQNSLSASTPVTATITSTITNSKFIVSCVTNGESTLEDHETHFVLRRIVGGSGSSINVGEGSGGNRQVISSVMSLGYYNNDQSSTPSATHLGPYLDSPNQAAGTAITYGMFVMGRNGTGTFYYGRTKDDTNQNYEERLPNNMMIMEVAP